MGAESARPHVVVLGAGFGGLYAAKALKNRPVRVTVIDRRNHHLFQPLLYQVATAVLDPSSIAAPIRHILRADNITVLLGEVESIDASGRLVHLKDGVVSFDYLILATGATHSYFGKDDWAPNAPGLKTIEDALEMRRRVLLAYEAAERESDPGRRKAWLTFAVIGGGPTGVELAGALAEISRHSLANDFRHFDPAEARIVLVEGLPRVLTAYPDSLSEKGRQSLMKLGVEVRTGVRVNEVSADGIRFGDEFLAAKTVLWAAGVAASPIGRSLGAPLDRAGRVKVTPDLTVPGNDRIYVIGDMAYVEDRGKPVPGLAPAAMQEGRHCALNILRAIRGESLLPFRYFDRGSFAVIGRGHAVGVIADRFRVTGLIAWLAWLFIHILYLIGFRNRFAVLSSWAYSYLTFRRHARLITGELRTSLPSVSDAPALAVEPPRDSSEQTSSASFH